MFKPTLRQAVGCPMGFDGRSNLSSALLTSTLDEQDQRTYAAITTTQVQPPSSAFRRLTISSGLRSVWIALRDHVMSAHFVLTISSSSDSSYFANITSAALIRLSLCCCFAVQMDWAALWPNISRSLGKFDFLNVSRMSRSSVKVLTGDASG
jgi:hypothetical protein